MLSDYDSVFNWEVTNRGIWNAEALYSYLQKTGVRIQKYLEFFKPPSF